MHPEAHAFVQSVVERTHHPRKALELGAYNVNGHCRGLFPSVTEWYGIDLRPGPNVDETANAETWKPQKRYDLVLCTEVLEHARHPEAIVETAHKALRKKGFFIMTCATTGRAPHSNDGAHSGFKDYYRNITLTEMDDWLRHSGFRILRLEQNRQACDLYALAKRL